MCFSVVSNELPFRARRQYALVEQSGRSRCDECKATKTILQELDLTAPTIIAKRKIMGAMAE